MYYYEVWPAEVSYHQDKPLTYSAQEHLNTGSVVEVKLKNKICLGLIAGTTKKPSFNVKPIERACKVEVSRLQLDLFSWLRAYYPAASGQIIRLFAPKTIPKKEQILKKPTAVRKLKTDLPKLTKAQQVIAKKLVNVSGTALLHGDTGTGKTRIYAELAKKVIEDGKSVVVLTPEIGLTPQLLEYFEEHFGDKVLVAHSNLTDLERRNIWLKIAKSQEPNIVIGPRSCLFLPYKNLGLIVVDEAHDSSYKQEQTPHYQATRVAAKLSQLSDGLCLLGTATPNISDYYSLEKHGAPISRLTDPVHKNIKPARISLLDRNKTENFDRSSICSNQLIDGISNANKKGLYSLLFLNRRGTARQVICQDCGWTAVCPNCDLPLTYHHDSHNMRCHVCNYTGNVPLECGNCHGNNLLFKTAGTKALYQELERLFPGYRIAKFDSDTDDKEQLYKHYQAIKQGKFDIIVGTQMLAKGLDLPKLGFVGVPFADTSLYLPDYTADEQTFQLISQVVGRVGRTSQSTEVVIQSYKPDHPALSAAVKKDWSEFYKNQLKERQAFLYPPYVYMLRLTISKSRDSSAQKASHKLHETLTKQNDIEVLPPSPRFHHHARGEYHWQIIIKSKTRQKLVRLISDLPANWRYDIDPVSLL